MQVFWYGTPKAVAAVMKRLEGSNKDFCGEYRETSLWDLTKEEKKSHWDETLAM